VARSGSRVQAKYIDRHVKFLQLIPDMERSLLRPSVIRAPQWLNFQAAAGT